MSTSFFLILSIIFVYTISNLLLLFLSYFVFGHLINVFKVIPKKEVVTSYYDFFFFYAPLIFWALFTVALKEYNSKSIENSAIESIFTCLEIPLLWLIKLFIEPNHAKLGRLLILIITISTGILLTLYFPMLVKH